MMKNNMTLDEIVRLSAQTGANAAIAERKKEQERERKEQTDRRLRNVKLLLRNYRVLREHVEHAVYEAELEESPADIIDDLMTGRDNTLIVESIKRSAARTATIIRHMEAMLGLYQTYCFSKRATLEDQRRWRVIDALYISDNVRTISELARDENVVERTIYNDIDIATERIAALIFGIDGVKKGRK